MTRHAVDRLLSVGIVLVTSSALGACSTRSPSTLADRFVKEGEPLLTMGDADALDPALFDPDATPPPLESLEVVPGPVVAPAATRLEDADPELSNALMMATVEPSPAAHRRVAASYSRHGVIDMAFDHLREAERLDPHDAATHDDLARLWNNTGLPGLGLGPAYRATYLAPDSPEAHNTLGVLLHALGDDTSARHAFERAQTLAPSAAYALNNLCYLAIRRGSLDDAVTTCEAAVAADPSLPQAHNNLAIVHLAAGRDDRAWAELQAAGPIWTALYNLGIAHLARGDHRAAAGAFTATSRARPEWADARRRARRAHEMLDIAARADAREQTEQGDSR